MIRGFARSKRILTWAAASLGLLCCAICLAPAPLAAQNAAPATTQTISLTNPTQYGAIIRSGNQTVDIPPQQSKILRVSQFPASIEYWSGSSQDGWLKQVFVSPGVYDFAYANKHWSLSKREAAAAVNGQPQNGVDPTSLSGTWNGLMTDDTGYQFMAELHLRAAPDGTLDGDIKWTMKASPSPAEQTKLGQSAVEYVAGQYDARSRVLDFQGVRTDDPQGLIATDKYRLIFAANGSALGGITEAGGSWRGVLALSRAAPK